MSVISMGLSAFTTLMAGGLQEHPMFEMEMLRLRGVPTTQS